MKSKTILLAACALLCSCSMELPIAATSNPLGDKVGTASALTVLGFTFNGDASVRRAAMEGGIREVSTVDLRTQNFLFIIQRRTCTVTGR